MLPSYILILNTPTPEKRFKLLEFTAEHSAHVAFPPRPRGAIACVATLVCIGAHCHLPLQKPRSGAPLLRQLTATRLYEVRVIDAP